MTVGRHVGEVGWEIACIRVRCPARKVVVQMRCGAAIVAGAMVCLPCAMCLSRKTRSAAAGPDRPPRLARALAGTSSHAS